MIHRSSRVGAHEHRLCRMAPEAGQGPELHNLHELGSLTIREDVDADRSQVVDFLSVDKRLQQYNDRLTRLSERLSQVPEQELARWGKELVRTTTSDRRIVSFRRTYDLETQKQIAADANKGIPRELTIARLSRGGRRIEPITMAYYLVSRLEERYAQLESIIAHLETRQPESSEPTYREEMLQKQHEFFAKKRAERGNDRMKLRTTAVHFSPETATRLDPRNSHLLMVPEDVDADFRSIGMQEGRDFTVVQLSGAAKYYKISAPAAMTIEQMLARGPVFIPFSRRNGEQYGSARVSTSTRVDGLHNLIFTFADEAPPPPIREEDSRRRTTDTPPPPPEEPEEEEGLPKIRVTTTDEERQEGLPRLTLPTVVQEPKVLEFPTATLPNQEKHQADTPQEIQHAQLALRTMLESFLSKFRIFWW